MVSEIGKFEDLLLKKDNKKVIVISEFHIGNYKDLKANIKRKKLIWELKNMIF